MIERIIIAIIVMGLLLFWIGVLLPLKTMINTRDSIFWIYERIFDIYPEEISRIFLTGYLQRIKYGVITLSFYDFQAACIEFERCIDNLLKYYEKYVWLVKQFPDMESDEERLREIRERIRWLKRRN